MIQNLSLKQKKIIIILGIIIIILIMNYIYNKTKINDTLEEEILVQNETIRNEKASEIEAEETIIVHITGAVKKPRNSKTKTRFKNRRCHRRSWRFNRRSRYFKSKFSICIRRWNKN